MTKSSSKRKPEAAVWRVVIRRADGSVLREVTRPSRYAAKKICQRYEDVYEVEILPPR